MRDGRLDLTLHVGAAKTGTTSLQGFLRRNRARLAEAGWLYPRSPGRTRHKMFAMWTRSPERVTNAMRMDRPGMSRYESYEELRREVPRRLLAEARKAELDRVLISDEALYGSPEDALEQVRAFADQYASGLRVVCYLRRQDDHLVSRYQQLVKYRETRTLAQRVAELDMAETYDHHARLLAWQRIVGPDELIVRRFEPDRFHKGSLFDDFAAAVGLGIPTDDRPGRTRNESLDAESVEFLRLLNIFRDEHGRKTGLPDNPAVIRDLAALGDGPKLTLPDAVLDDFMARWADSNAAVARDLLGEPDGVLFRSPRKTSHTTTEQRLEPDRISHFFAALEQLPEEFEAPLREIAEREARRHERTPPPP